MSDHEHSHAPSNGPGYETTDVHTGPIYKFIFALIALMFIGIAAARVIFMLLGALQQEDYAKLQTTKEQQTRQVPPGPLLQVTNHDDLLTFRAKQAQDVSGHATWLDKNAKVVRLPIDRAIDLVSQRGLPVFKGEAQAADSTAAKGTAPAQPVKKK